MPWMEFVRTPADRWVKDRFPAASSHVPWHGWQFDVTTGRHALNPRIEHTRFPVKIEGNDVLVEIP